ncbi:MAG: hypothetical protein KJ872_12100 [Alphaproteobacteria bacterium]|nr:hypothetical protein [Alphaproteobacteria bacterium]
MKRKDKSAGSGMSRRELRQLLERCLKQLDAEQLYLPAAHLSMALHVLETDDASETPMQ